MLYVTVQKNAPDGAVSTIEWHVGEGRLKIYIPKPNVATVLEIQADGDELDFILTTITNLPYVPGGVVMAWHGDFAKFIAFNL